MHIIPKQHMFNWGRKVGVSSLSTQLAVMTLPQKLHFHLNKRFLRPIYPPVLDLTSKNQAFLAHPQLNICRKCSIIYGLEKRSMLSKAFSPSDFGMVLCVDLIIFVFQLIYLG